MDVCRECCVLSGRGLWDELITRPEESYRLWCVVVCDLENLVKWGGHDPRWVAAPQEKKSSFPFTYRPIMSRKYELLLASLNDK
jgi:hypothetical protein